MKVLISRPDTIGDVILALHGVKQLKLLRPDWEVWMHASPHTEGLLGCVGFLDGVHVSLRELEARSFDVVVDLMAKPQSAFNFARLGVKRRIGNGARWFRFLYHKTAYIRRSKSLCNEAEYNWQLIRKLDKSFAYKNLDTKLSRSDITLTHRGEITCDSGAYVIQPQALNEFGWSLEQWTSLAERLLEADRQVVFLLDAAERGYKQELDAFCQKQPNAQVCSVASIEDALQIFLNAETFCGPATGLHHLAAACELSGVALQSEASEKHPYRWSPYRSRLTLARVSESLTVDELVPTLLEGKPLPNQHNALSRKAVSAFVVCQNEEDNITRCLSSLSFCDEIVVVDSGSTDQTVALAKQCTPKVLHREWRGHSDQKQYALSQCRHPWVLNIDADEEVSMELKGRILRFLQDGKPEGYDGFNVSRLVSFLDIWWDRGGWYPEYRLRFFNREKTSWGGVDPHEKALVDGRVGQFKESLYHYTYEDISHQIRSLNSHSSLSAQCLYNTGKRCYFWNIVLNPLSRFLKFFIVKRGFLHGLPGLLVACIEAQYTLVKYMKLWDLQRKDHDPDVKNTPRSEEHYELNKSTAADGQQQGSPVR